MIGNSEFKLRFYEFCKTIGQTLQTPFVRYPEIFDCENIAKTMESGRIVVKVMKVVDISPAEALSRIAKVRSELQAKTMDENDMDDLTGKYDILVNDMELAVGADALSSQQFGASQSDASISPVKSPKKKRKHSQEEVEKIEDASSVGSIKASSTKRRR